MRRHHRWQRLDVIPGQPAHDLLRLDLHLAFLAADEGNHVGHDVHRGHARITRARDRLHRRGQNFRDTELGQRRKAHGQRHRGTVRICGDAALPAAALALNADQRKVIPVDFRDQQRHVAFHTVVLRIGDDKVARVGERAFNFGGDGGVHRRKHQFRRLRRRLARLHSQSGHARGHGAIQTPLRGLGIQLAGRAVARAGPNHFEPGMIFKELDETLAHHAGGAQHADGNLTVAAHCGCSFNRRSTSVRYRVTDSRSSAFGTRSPEVWATWIDPGPRRNGRPHWPPNAGISVV